MVILKHERICEHVSAPLAHLLGRQRVRKVVVAQVACKITYCIRPVVAIKLVDKNSGSLQAFDPIRSAGSLRIC